MLVLERKYGQSVYLMVGDIRIEVAIVKVGAKGGVKLGFDAPASVKILRRELAERERNDVHEGGKPRSIR